MSSFLRGLAWPVTGDDGLLGTATDDDVIRAHLIQITISPRMERVYRPDLGVDAHRYVFEPLSTLTLDLIRGELLAAYSRWEPGAGILDVEIRETTGDHGAGVEVTVRYVVLATQTTGEFTQGLGGS